MPVYRFRIRDGSNGPDPEPAELDNYKAARSELVTMTGAMLRDVDGAFWSEGHWQIDVTNESGLILCSLQVNGIEAPAVKDYST